MERPQKKAIIADLQKKMVLLAGPRQSGKTTLAKQIASSFDSYSYLNYDSIEDQKIISSLAWPSTTEYIILDEIHKMPNWKNFLKGLYDTKPSYQKILVTGSARLEIFRQVGDSLAGRFFMHRLLPLSAAECQRAKVKASIDHFLERGSFPEPFFASDATDAKRWRKQYMDSLLHNDILQFDHIQNLRAIQLVFELLRTKVGSPISYSSIAQDVGISPNTVKKYVQILEALYIIFIVTPYSRNIARSLLKEPKIYFFDVGLVKGSEGILFENFTALSLLKHIYYKQDIEAEDLSLHYLRTKEQKEVDFAITRDHNLELLIEAKLSNYKVSKDLLYFCEKYNKPGLQLIKNTTKEFDKDSIEVRNAENFLPHLSL
jgi:uncharacterized protein